MELAYGAAPGDAGLSESVLTTADGGASWIDHGTPAAVRGSLSADATLQCSSDATCFLDMRGVILRTSDGGARWQRIRGVLNGILPHGQRLKTPLACSPSGGCMGSQFNASGTAPELAWLRPGASSFERMPLPDLPARFTPLGLACPTSRRCVLTGEVASNGVLIGGVTFATSNPGPMAVWTREPTLHGRWIDSISCPSTTFCGATMEERATPTETVEAVALSRDGGATWIASKRLASSPVPSQIACSAASRCAVVVTPYAPYFDNYVASAYQTTNGGLDWSASPLTRFPAAGGEPYISGSVACLAATCLADASTYPPPWERGGRLVPGGVLDESTGTAWSPVTPIAAATQATGLTCTSSSTCWQIDRHLSATGYAATLLTSANDGANWAPVTVPAGVAPVLLGGCQSPTTCEVIGVSGATLYEGQLGNFDFSGASLAELSTSDAGSSWSMHPIPGPDQWPMDASCTSPTACVVLGANLTAYPSASLESTSDGSTWSAFTVPFEPLGSDQLSGTVVTGWALGCGSSGTCLFAEPTGVGDSLLWASSDAGASWAQIDLPPDAAIISGVFCGSGQDCIVSDEIPAGPDASPTYGLDKTTDAGMGWSAQAALPSGYVRAPPQLACTSLSACTVVASGLNRSASAYSTENGGTTWTPLVWNATIPPHPADGIQAAGLLTCSSTTCLVEVKGIDDAGLGASDFQLLRDL